MRLTETLSYDDVLLKPQHGVLRKRVDADISSEVVPGIRLNVPILSANMPSVTGPRMVEAMERAGGMGVLHRFYDDGIIEALKDFERVQGSLVGVSIGIDGLTRAGEFVRMGAQILFLDVAHGDHEQVVDFCGQFWKNFDGNVRPKLVIGNVATRDAALRLAPYADALKVGIGPGAACVTREVTGFGVGQLSAVMEVREALDDQIFDCCLIADGGIKNSGDIVKALAAGADTVMIGSLFAGCDEAPEPGVYYGNASKHVNGHHAPEGVKGKVARTGSVVRVMKKLAWGIRSGVSYGGGTNLAEFRENAEWLRVSSQVALESRARV